MQSETSNTTTTPAKSAYPANEKLLDLGKSNCAVLSWIFPGFTSFFVDAEAFATGTKLEAWCVVCFVLLFDLTIFI